ncbi:unnamed protein product [Pedinophyceae sp. YPF-701]|nr:unnamed protein product [Pedinophyceae sp. YPF-701]
MSNPFKPGTGGLYDEDPGQGAPPSGAWGGAPSVPPAALEGQIARPPPPPPKKKGLFSRGAQDPPPQPPVASAPPPGMDREQYLAQREQQLNQREAELARREQEMRSSGFKKNNWPLFCPIIRHNIKEDIPEDCRRVVRLGYLTYLATVVMCVYQFVAVSCAFATEGGDVIDDWFLSLIVGGFTIPLSLLLWYIRLYNACLKGSSLTFIVFFVFYFVHIVFCVVMAIAPPIRGDGFFMTGFLSAIKLLDRDDDKWVGAIYIIGAALWSGLTAGCVLVMGMANSTFRGAGGTAAARREANARAARGAADYYANSQVQMQPTGGGGAANYA